MNRPISRPSRPGWGMAQVRVKLQETSERVDCWARIEPALGINWSIRVRSARHAVPASTPTELERRYVVECRDAERGRRVLADGVADAILESDDQGWQVRIEDDEIRLRAHAQPSPELAEQLSDAALRLAWALVLAEHRYAAALPVAAIADTWASVARWMDARFDRRALTIVRHAPVGLLRAQLCGEHDDGWRASVHFYFLEPLSPCFAIAHRGPDELARPDLGDAAFDAAFRVESLNPAQLRRLLGPEVRRRLLHLGRITSQLVVADGGIDARALGSRATERNELCDLFSATIGVARALCAR